MRSMGLAMALTMLGCAGAGTFLSSGAAHAQGAGNVEFNKEAMSHYMASLIYERTGNYPKALEELQKAAELAPNARPIVLRLLSVYYAMRDFDNALNMAERAVEIEPENVFYRIWLGRIYYELGRLDEASESFTMAIDMDPDSPAGYEALAEVEEESNDLVGAIEVYERLLKLRPDAPLLHYRLGLNLAKINDNQAAAEALEKALALNAELTPARYLLGLLYQGLERYDDAIRQFELYLEKERDHAGSRTGIVGALALKGDYAAALDRVNALIDAGDAAPRRHVERMYLLLRQDGAPDAGLAVAPSEAPLVGTILRALVRKKAGEPYNDLIDSLDTLEGDLDAEASEYLGGLLSVFGQEQAGTFLRSHLLTLIHDRGEKRSHTLEVALGRVLLFMDKNEEAEQVFLGVLERFGGDKNLHYYLATVSENLKKFGETEKHLRACLAFDANDPDILNFLGYHYAEQNKNLDLAEALLRRALEMDPENGFYLDSLGWIYYRKGDADRAIDLIQRAIRNMDTDDAVLRDHLGDAYLLKGDRQRAIVEWRRALRLDPSIEGVQSKIDEQMKLGGE